MPPTTCADLLRTITSEPGRPRITWYGDAGERVELSGAVLENWVNKTTNLLVEEFDVGPGARVLLDLPPHWRSVVWALATWRAGACVVTPEVVGAPPPEVTVTDVPERHVDGSSIVAVALPALSRRYDGALQAGAMDASTAVMTYADVLLLVPTIDLDAPALAAGGAIVTHRDLVATPTPGPADGNPRVLLDGAVVTTLGRILRAVLEVLAADGSIVLVAGEAAGQLVADPERRARLIATERISSVW